MSFKFEAFAFYYIVFPLLVFNYQICFDTFVINGNSMVDLK